MFMNMNIILFYNMWLLLRTGIWPTHGKEKLRFFSLLVWIVQRWLGGIWFISCVGGESIEPPRDQHKPRTLLSIMNVIYQRLWIIGINFLNYLVCHWQTRHIKKNQGNLIKNMDWNIYCRWRRYRRPFDIWDRDVFWAEKETQ